jgi:SAM-dependent methyltransferase
MSATGRNLEGSERHADDFYETPAWCTRAILPHLFGPFCFAPVRAEPKTVLDAGCGTGAILRAVGEALSEESLLIGVDKSVHRVRQANEYEPYPDRDHFYELFDFFDVGKGGADTLVLPDDSDPTGEGVCMADLPFDLVIANPPYSETEAFVSHALTIGTTVCFLLRLNWLASKKRAAFHRAHPADVFVLPKRPSFTEDSRTDATEYAWFVWGEGRGNRWFLLDVPA